jgi:uncharacterized membrane protein
MFDSAGRLIRSSPPVWLSTRAGAVKFPAKASAKRIYIASLLLVLFLLNLHPAITESITTDEDVFYAYGHQIVFEHTTSRDSPSGLNFNSKMPLTAVNLLPEWLCRKITWEPLRAIIEKELNSDPDRYIYLGRLITIVSSFLLAMAVYFWAKEMYGDKAGLISLTLYVFSPNMLAHSHLVTSDFFASCFVFLAVYCFWRCVNAPSKLNLFASAVALGIAQLTKYTAIHLFPVLILLLALNKARGISERLQAKQFKQLAVAGLKFAALTAFFLAVTASVITAGFLGERNFVRLKDYALKSASFRGLPPALGNVCVPLPYAYLYGLDWVKHDDETGNYRNLYLLGELQTEHKRGWWYYFLVAFALKTTFGLLGLLLLAVVALKHKGMSLFRNEIFLLVPVGYFFVFFSLFFHTQIGLRYILPIYPFLFVLVGTVVSQGKTLNKVALVLVVAHVLSSLSYHPHYLSYFNEFVTDRKTIYRYLADSNVDWGQDHKYVKKYIAAHKELQIQLRPERATVGLVVVRVNDLVGIYDPERFRWLREKYKPMGRIAYSFLIFDIPASNSVDEFREHSNAADDDASRPRQ